MDIVLRYIGDQGDQRRYVVGVPGTDLTLDQINEIANLRMVPDGEETRRMTVDEVMQWLISTGAWEWSDTPHPAPEPANPES